MHDPRSTYLTTQVKTASPQRLRLMLIEGAQRFLRQARLAHHEQLPEAYSTSVERARDIVTELLASIRPGPHALSDSARALYGYLFRALGEAQLLHDVQKIDDALRVLEIENETWQQVCELEIELPAEESESDFRNTEIVDSGATAPSSASFSLDA